MDENEIKARLRNKNKEFRLAFDEHRMLEKKLSKLHAMNHLTDEEELKEKQLKKKKLLLKDKMYFLMEEFRKSVE